jgi:hypothetical protein
MIEAADDVEVSGGLSWCGLGGDLEGVQVESGERQGQPCCGEI